MSPTEDTHNFNFNQPIVIESQKYGKMEFSELLLKDLSWLDNEKIQKLQDREFIVQLLHSHLLNPKLEQQEIREWTDSELSAVAIYWFNSQQEKSLLSDTASFGEIKKAIYSEHELLAGDMRKDIDDLFSSQKQFINGLGGLVKIPPLVTQFASTIASHHNTFSQMANSIVLPQLSLPNSILGNIANMSEIGKITVELGSVFQQASASAQMLSNIVNNFTPLLPNLNISSALLDTAKFFATLPNLGDLNKLLDEAKEGGEAFKKAGYSFITSDYVSFSTVRRYASVSPRIRSAVITNSLAASTRNSAFEQQLKQIFQQSTILCRRWSIVSQAIQAHRRREYYVSIPTLLAQVEGVVGDALILNGLVASKDHKLYMKEPDGKLKLDKKYNKPIEVPGLGRLIQRSSWQTHPALQEVADLITTQLAGERNHILHGRKTNYGSAKLSV